MNAEERHLITDLFNRLRAYGPMDKDAEAEQLIISLARQNPDAGYMLVQNVLVQEQTIAQMQQQIDDLQAQLAQVQRAPAGRSGGFLGGTAGGAGGGMFGGRQSAGSVPMSHPAPQPQYAPPPQAPVNPWGRAAPAAPAPMQQPAPQAASGGGGFMRSALGMAAGVAGGMLAANAIKNMMGGGDQTASQPASSDLGNNDQGNYDASGDNYGYGNAEETGGEAYDNNDPGSFDAGGGGFDGE